MAMAMAAMYAWRSKSGRADREGQADVPGIFLNFLPIQ